MNASYILPLRRERVDPISELAQYLGELSAQVQVIVVDGSPTEVYAAHRAWLPDSILHVPVDPTRQTMNGKVGGVLTGLSYARHERVIIADDDVRYDLPSLSRMVDLLGDFAVVRPQNYFDPLPWHARLDTARILVNRVSGGDWPGTIGLRRSYLQRTNGYDGSILFENLELVRTVRAAGGNETVALDLYVRRLPSTTRHFFAQRVRQAYDEFARPVRLIVSLAVLPLLATASLLGRWKAVGGAAAISIAAAETGRRRAGGTSVFPAQCTLLTPLWLVERGCCSWLALSLRLIRGGVPYRGRVLRRAATPDRELRRRYGVTPADHAGVTA